MHLRIFMIACLLICGTAAMSQDLSSIPGVPQNALIFIDSVESKNGMEGLDPTKIALIDIVKGSKLKEKYGPRGEDGVIFIETVPFARKRYTRMFGELSADYQQQLKKEGSDSAFLYMLDGAPIESNEAQMLAALERKNIESIKVIPAAKLADVPGDHTGKKYGILITSKTN
ncbi:hypothetical protein [Chitinophaga sp. YR627]|uniref:hypothetical protein n=1 Tax=Chitinophaga sp. YR627 TaxID=1881041 RepID=UPI0011606489|nr:hypothetical protein [Chitinophaga sp. YR627]